MHNVHSIADYQADPSGQSLSTRAIQRAIDDLAARGGTLYFPPGTWLTGSITLRSGITLQLDPAATLLGSPDLADYEQHETTIHEGQGRYLIYARECRDVTLCGGGTIDGNGMAFWDPPAEGSLWYRQRGGARPIPMLEFVGCQRLRLENIKVCNSPGWTLHPMSCSDVTITGLVIDNHMFGPNTDGIDLDGCQDVRITGCRVRCGDDAIIIKATPLAGTTERVTVSDCVVESNCVGIGLGQETQSGIRQVAITNCVARRCNRMIGVMCWDGGFIEDVVISNVVGDTHCSYSVGRPIHIETKQLWSLPQTRPLGTIRNISISNVIARTQGRVIAVAQQGGWIENVTLRDIRLDYGHLEDNSHFPDDPKFGSNQFANENREARRQNAAFVLENVRGLEMDGIRIHWSPGDPPDATLYGPRRAPGSPVPGYRVVWARNVHDSRIAVPHCRSNRADLDPVMITESPGSVVT